MDKFNKSVFTLILLLIASLSPVQGFAYSMFKSEESLEELTIENYFTKIVLDKVNGGLIKSYVYKDKQYQITNLRYLAPNRVVSSILHEIIPPPSPTGTVPPIWWPGECFGKRAVFEKTEKSPYTFIVNTTYSLSTTYKVELRKTYTFYYDKPYFDIEYVFVNREDTIVKFDLSSAWGRSSSFSIEISTSYAGDASDDYQIYGTTEGRVVLRQGYSSPNEPDIVEGKVSYIAIVSSEDDYQIPQGIIVIPLNDTVSKTYGVWFEQAGRGVEGAPVSSVIRLEMKTFTLKGNSLEKFSFRVYMGPLVRSFLQELGLARFMTEVIKLYDIPSELPSYRVQTSYKLQLSFNPDDKNLYPNANISIYRILVDGSEQLIGNYPAESQTITVDQPGIYKLVINPSSGMTRDGKHVYKAIIIDDQVGPEYFIPVYTDKLIVLNVTFESIVWLYVSLIDENDQLLTDLPTQVTIIFESTSGRRIVKNLSSPEAKFIIPPDTYRITVKPRELGDRVVSDVYFNNEYILYRIHLDGFSFEVNVADNPVDQWIIIRYASTRAGGVNTSLVFILITAFLILVAVLIFVMIYTMRRRRI